MGMASVSIREARRRLSELVSAAERGESITITRRGKEVAQIGPVAPEGGRRLPSLADFRATIKVKGKPMSQVVTDMRNEERY
jgi:prevent-host-death family protein